MPKCKFISMLSEMKLNHSSRVRCVSNLLSSIFHDKAFLQKITVAVFGSVQRMESLQSSDIDVMIVFNDARIKSIYNSSGLDRLLYSEIRKIDDTLANFEYHEDWKFCLLAEELKLGFASNGLHKDFLLSVHFLIESTPVWNEKMYLTQKRSLLTKFLSDEPCGGYIFKRISTFNKHFESLLAKKERSFGQAKVMKICYSRRLMGLSIFFLDFTQFSEDEVIQFLNADPISRLFAKREISVDSVIFRPYLEVLYGLSRGTFSKEEPFSDEVYKSSRKRADDFIISIAEHYVLKAKLNRYSFSDCL